MNGDRAIQGRFSSESGIDGGDSMDGPGFTGTKKLE